MPRFCTSVVAVSIASLMLLAVAHAQSTDKSDLSKQPTLYVVGYAHLDTEWRWEYPQVINEYIRKTMQDNFTLIDKYPHYIFNFSGANRYRFMKEYFPADFAELKGYVDSGRWLLVVLEIFASKCNYALKLLWSAGLYLLDQTPAQFALFSFLPCLLHKLLTLLIQLRDALFRPCNAVVDLGRSTQRLQPPDKSESFGRSDSGSC
jgi:hypothetical protein